jgi:hypothetical protein
LSRELGRSAGPSSVPGWRRWRRRGRRRGRRPDRAHRGALCRKRRGAPRQPRHLRRRHRAAGRRPDCLHGSPAARLAGDRCIYTLPAVLPWGWRPTPPGRPGSASMSSTACRPHEDQRSPWRRAPLHLGRPSQCRSGGTTAAVVHGQLRGTGPPRPGSPFRRGGPRSHGRSGRRAEDRACADRPPLVAVRPGGARRQSEARLAAGEDRSGACGCGHGDPRRDRPHGQRG